MFTWRFNRSTSVCPASGRDRSSANEATLVQGRVNGAGWSRLSAVRLNPFIYQLYCRAIRPPTTSVKDSRLRVFSDTVLFLSLSFSFSLGLSFCLNHSGDASGRGKWAITGNDLRFHASRAPTEQRSPEWRAKCLIMDKNVGERRRHPMQRCIF